MMAQVLTAAMTGSSGHRFVNQSKSAGLAGMVGIYLGMRGRLTKKVYPPVLVQEATFEVVGIVPHSSERYGHPSSTSLMPAENHECWKRGWVKCDYLPLRIEVRFDGCTEHFTGLGRPGVWFLEPVEDTWEFPVETAVTVNHPQCRRSKKLKKTSRKKRYLDVTRTQLPIGPELVCTFQNVQGTTIRGPEKQPKGLILDVYRPWNMRGDGGAAEYFQHLYMGLGRAQRLDRILIRNFPRADDGDLDWSIFQSGPPDYLTEFFHALEKLARKTMPRLLKAQCELGMPAWEDCPACQLDTSMPPFAISSSSIPASFSMQVIATWRTCS